MISHFFKTRKARKFDFKNRYYDPDKEDLERRIRLAKLEADPERAESVRYIDHWKKNSRIAENARSNKRKLFTVCVEPLYARSLPVPDTGRMCACADRPVSPLQGGDRRCPQCSVHVAADDLNAIHV